MSESAKKGTIFIIEDDPGGLGFLTFCLQDEGYTVVGATSIAQAKEVIEGISPDVIISDLSLPDGWGADFLRTLKLERPCTYVAMTGYKVDDVLDKVFDYYLTKPVDLENVLKLLEQLLAVTRS